SPLHVFFFFLFSFFFFFFSPFSFFSFFSLFRFCLFFASNLSKYSDTLLTTFSSAFRLRSMTLSLSASSSFFCSTSFSIFSFSTLSPPPSLLVHLSFAFLIFTLLWHCLVPPCFAVPPSFLVLPFFVLPPFFVLRISVNDDIGFSAFPILFSTTHVTVLLHSAL